MPHARAVVAGMTPAERSDLLAKFHRYTAGERWALTMQEAELLVAIADGCDDCGELAIYEEDTSAGLVRLCALHANARAGR